MANNSYKKGKTNFDKACRTIDCGYNGQNNNTSKKKKGFKPAATIFMLLMVAFFSHMEASPVVWITMGIVGLALDFANYKKGIF